MQASLFPMTNAVEMLAVSRGGFILRDFQATDANEISQQWGQGNLRVLCVHATGLGKSLMADRKSVV